MSQCGLATGEEMSAKDSGNPTRVVVDVETMRTRRVEAPGREMGLVRCISVGSHVASIALASAISRRALRRLTRIPTVAAIHTTYCTVHATRKLSKE